MIFRYWGRDGYAARVRRWADPFATEFCIEPPQRYVVGCRSPGRSHEVRFDDHRELCSAAVCACVVVVLRYWFLYTMVGGIAAATCYYYLPAQVAQNLGAFIVLGTLVCFWSGRHRGRQREAFHLRLQAQMALCQIQIERNTSARRLRSIPSLMRLIRALKPPST